MAQKEEIKKIKLKNYLLLVLIFLAGIGLTLYFCNWYHVYDEYQKETPVIRGTLSEITNEELEHYVSENPTTVIYMCTSSELVCRNFEKDFVKLITKENLQDSLVYLNLSNIDQSQFVSIFNDRFPYKVSLTNNYPALVIFENGEVENLLQGKETEKLTITKAKQFIEMNKIGE